MKRTYNEKFKDRSPKETIDIIKKYFKELGLTTRVEQIICSKSATWSCVIKLYLNSLPILSQNGKGITKLYCLASGYGELYERFCSKEFIYNNPYLSSKFMKLQYQKNGYYFDKDEKQITFEEAFSSTKAGRDYKNIFDIGPEFKNYIDLIMDNKYIGIPFKHTKDNDKIIYFDPRLSTCLHNSSGLACGNSFFEAFNQGMSEIYEHSCSYKLFENLQQNYYILNLKNINNPQLEETINRIKKNNYLYIFDLSYNFQVPVLMSLIINKYTHAISINFGSFPIFDIALERILTELFQGTHSFSDVKIQGQYPYRAASFEEFQNVRATTEVFNPCFPEEILFRMVEIEECSNIFLKGQYSNKEIYEYMLEINDLNNFDIYYYIHSNFSNMYAIELLNTTAPQYFMRLDTLKTKIKTLEINDAIQNISNLFMIINNYIITQKFDIESYMNIANKIYNLPDIQKFIYYYIQMRNPFILNVTGRINTFKLIQFSVVLYNDYTHSMHSYITFLEEFKENKNIYSKLLTYTTLYRFILSNYTVEELINIFDLLHLDYNELDIANLNNNEYWLKEILLADINNYYLSDDYNNFIKRLIK